MLNVIQLAWDNLMQSMLDLHPEMF